MSAALAQSNRKLVRSLGLMASASIMSLMMGGEAQAACVVNPNQPLNNITTPSTTVTCTGVSNAGTVFVNTDGAVVEVQGAGATLSNGNVTLNGNSNTFNLGFGASVNNLFFITAGSNNTVEMSGQATDIATAIGGAGDSLQIYATASVAARTGDIDLAASAGQDQSVVVQGVLTASSGNGTDYLLTGGTGNQSFTITGTLTGLADGRLINGGDGDDRIFIGPNASISNGAFGPVYLEGGSGADTITWRSGNSALTRSAQVSGVENAEFIAGAGVLNMGGAANYTNVNITSGVVSFFDLTAMGSNTANFAVAGGATAEFNRTGTHTLNQDFAGAGTIRQREGNITYGGNGAGFNGTFILDAPNATLGNADVFGTANIVANGALNFVGFNLANNVSGTGQVSVTGPGNSRLSGTNTFSGGLFVDGGTLDVASVTSLGTGFIGSSTAGSILSVGNTSNEVLANDIMGDLALVKSGAGILDLTGSNSYTGGTLISGGAIRVDGFARLGAGPVLSNAGGSLILNYNGAGQLLQTTPFMTGDGSFIKEGTGNVVMNQTSTYTGGTTIRAGRIGLNNGAALGTGDIQIDSGAELGIGGIVLNNSITGSGLVRKTASNLVELYGDNRGFTGTIQVEDGVLFAVNGNALGSGVLQIDSGTNVQLGAVNDSTVAADLAGGGAFEKLGGGLVTVTGDGSLFSGGIAISDGVLEIEGSPNIGNSSSVFIGSNGTLQLNTASSINLFNALSGGGNLVKTGTGTVFLTGSNTHSGGTDIQQGAIRVINLNALGTGPVTVQSGAALDLSISGSATYNGAISGAGILRKSDVGDLTLISNTLSGGLDIVGGRVIVGTAAALGSGPVTTAADTQLVFNNSTTEVSNTLISGAGALTMDGTGSLIVNNANSYGGGTIINSGRIGLNNGQGLGTGNVIVLSGAILGIGNVTLANNVSGAGQIVKTASGVGTLTGSNTHTGGVDIQGGSLEVTGNAPLGTGTVSIASGATLNYTNPSALTFSNGLTGAGTFNKLGTGQLTFGNNFTIGTLNLNAGRARINTIGTGNVNVGANATLDGTGRIVGNLTNNGTVAPGNSIGTLTVQGNYTHNSGSVLEVEFDAAGNIDLLDVTGNATLNGGTLRFVSIGGAEGQGGTFLRTGGSLTGTFATVETVGALLPLAVVYEPNRAFMAPSVLTARPSTFNAQSLAAADTALGFIDSIGVGDLRHGQGNRIWLNGFSAWGERSASGTTLAYDHETRGLSGGVNLAVGDAITVGLAAGWAKGDITLGANGGGGDQSSVLGSIHARYSGTGFTLGGGLLYGKIDQDTLRNVSFNGFSGSVSGTTDSKVFGGFAELGVPLGSTGSWAFSANLRGSYIRQTQDAYTESGTSPLRLSLGELKTSTLEGHAGLTAKAKLWDDNQGGEDVPAGLDLRIDLGARYLGTVGDRAIPVTFAVSNAGIVLQGDTRDTLQGRFGLGLDYTIRSGATFSIGYKGEVGKTDRHAVMAGVSFAF